MKIVYATEDFPVSYTKSIFLAGPTPRSSEVKSWRPEALRLLKASGYDGVVFVPETLEGGNSPNYPDQISWENEGLNRADCILFWVPRDLLTMPAFTTNHEHGEWFKSGKVVLGAPVNAPKMPYLQHKAFQQFEPQASTLENTIKAALEMIGEGALRNGGECQVPLYIWRTSSFQAWYDAQKKAGNRLDGAKVVWTFRVGPKKEVVFFWALHVNIYIASENRYKNNEVVISRPDIYTMVMYRQGRTLMDSTVVLVREFRSPATTADGFIWESPSGSSEQDLDPLELVAREVQEETGLKIDKSRIIIHSSRQMPSTLSAHKAHVFFVEITEEELDLLRKQAGIAHGAVADTERTYVEIRTVKEILENDLVDWSMLGMILSVLVSEHNQKEVI